MSAADLKSASIYEAVFGALKTAYGNNTPTNNTLAEEVFKNLTVYKTIVNAKELRHVNLGWLAKGYIASNGNAEMGDFSQFPEQNSL